MRHFIAILAFGLAPISAYAQNDVINFDPSVTIYSFDEPAPQVDFANPAPPREVPNTSRAPSLPVAETDYTTSTLPNPDAGWLGAVWKGRANIGASLQKGNTEQDAVNADAQIQAKWGDTHRAKIKAEVNHETEDSAVTENNQQITGEYDYFFAPKWFWNNTLGFEKDKIARIDLRSTAGTGLGYQPYESDDLNLQFVLGPSYLREDFENGGTDESIAGHWALDYDQKVLDKRFELFHNHDLLVPGDDTDGFLFESESGVRIPIINGVIGTAQIDFDWDNDPAPGTVEDDTTYSAKIGYEW